jgi:hypothetical protein
MKWSNPRHSIGVFCHEMVKPHDHFMTKHTDTMPGLHQFMTKQTDTMSGASPVYDKTHWYYVWGLTISWQNTLMLCLGFTSSWQNRLILCLGLQQFMTKHTDTMSGSWSFHHQTHWYYPDIVSVCFVINWWSPRHSISLFCHELVKPRHSISVFRHEMVKPQT